MKNITLQEIASLIGNNFPSKIMAEGFCVDSRKLKPGDLFFALPGNKVDGHSFLKEVQDKGACGAIVHQSFSDPDITLPLIRVSDVLLSLQELARKILQLRKTKVIGITGSIGKTTSKGFVFHFLKNHFHTFASPSSYNSQITLALSILLAEGDEDFLILEMGMTHAGDIAKLISIAPPSIALLTNVAIQHACNFSDGLSGISREKGSIFSHPSTQLGILPQEIPLFDEIKEVGNCSKLTFSLHHREVDFFLEANEDGVVIYEHGIPHKISLLLPVKALNHNFLAAVVIARALGISWESISELAPSLKLPQMRFEQVNKKGITFINDAYNANPDSMKAALESLPMPDKDGKTIAVLSEMTELGMYSDAGHAMVAEAALHHADCLLCVGSRCETMKKIWKREKKTVELFEIREELEKRLQELVRPGDVVLLKGARFWALDQVLRLFE